ncbi:MAG: hypothetical protein WCP46_07690 [Alphaproteobacteria bacterium]
MNTTTKVVARKNLVHRSRDNTDNNRQSLLLSTSLKSHSNQAHANVPTSTKILTEHINKHVWFVVAAVDA